jgi:hypothetical protein
MKNYREHLAAVPDDEPVIPFIGVALKDIFFVEEGNDKVRGSPPP